ATRAETAPRSPAATRSGRPAPAGRLSAVEPGSLLSLHAGHHAGIRHRRRLVWHVNRRPARLAAPAGDARMIAGRQIFEIELTRDAQRRTELAGANGNLQRAVLRSLSGDVEAAAQRVDDLGFEGHDGAAAIWHRDVLRDRTQLHFNRKIILHDPDGTRQVRTQVWDEQRSAPSRASRQLIVREHAHARRL